MKLFQVVYITVFGLSFFSCNPAKQATKLYNKAKGKDLPTVAKLSQADFPCGVSLSDTVVTFLPGKTDTVIKNQVVEVDCPDINERGDTVYIKTKVNVPCKCEEKAPDTLYRHITNFERDPRDSIVLKEQGNSLIKSESNLSTWKTVGLIFIGLFVVALIAIIIKIFK